MSVQSLMALSANTLSEKLHSPKATKKKGLGLHAAVSIQQAHLVRWKYWKYLKEFEGKNMALSISDICENTKVRTRMLNCWIWKSSCLDWYKKYLFFFQLQKLAREMSLLGNYETASVYYQGVIQQIHRLLSTIDDPGRKQKWQQIQGEVAQEYDVVKNIMQTLALFKGMYEL